MFGQEDFDFAAEEGTRGGIVGADGMGAVAAAMSVEASGKDPGVVEDDQVGRTEEFGKVAEELVLPGLTCAKEMEKTGVGTVE